MTSSQSNARDAGEEYARQVAALNKQSCQHTLHITECQRLGQFLDNASRSGDPSKFATMYEITPSSLKKLDPLAPTLSIPALPQTSSCIVFLAGYPDRNVLLRLAAKFNVDPRFFDIHLSFIRDAVTSCERHPSFYTVPSSLLTIYQTRVPTIGATTGVLNYESITKFSEDVDGMMEGYRTGLVRGGGWKPFDSIVRDIEVHDLYRFTLHQNITITIKRERVGDHSRYIALIWSDAGKPLSEDPSPSKPPGPWMFDPLARSAHFRPVALHPPWAGAQQPGNDAQLVDDTRSIQENIRLFQSLTLLQANYDESLLDRKRMWQDPVYALTDLFTYMVNAETQYLETIKFVLDMNTIQKGAQRDHSLLEVRGVLNSCSRALERCRDEIHSRKDFLQLQIGLQKDTKGNDTAELIIRDLEYQIRKTNELLGRCAQELSNLMSEISADDVRWSRGQTLNGTKLAILAAVYLPMSVSCSLFGMPFFSTKRRRLGTELWVCVTIAICMTSAIVFFWDRIHVSLHRTKTKVSVIRTAKQDIEKQA